MALWNVENLVIYIGMQRLRNPPTKFVFCSLQFEQLFVMIYFLNIVHSDVVIVQYMCFASDYSFVDVSDVVACLQY